MDVIKKHLFWIILGVLLLGGVGFWVATVPGTIDEAKSQMNNDAKQIKTAAGKPASIVTPKHVEAVKGYIGKMDSEKGDMLKTIQSWPRISELKEIEKRFKDVPPADKRIEFDAWLLKYSQS